MSQWEAEAAAQDKMRQERIAARLAGSPLPALWSELEGIGFRLDG